MLGLDLCPPTWLIRWGKLSLLPRGARLVPEARAGTQQRDREEKHPASERCEELPAEITAQQRGAFDLVRDVRDRS